jgi:GTPase SAR1 family protein
MPGWNTREKAVIVGDQACGKTCLNIVFNTDRFPNVSLMEIYVDYQWQYFYSVGRKLLAPLGADCL